jgi:protein tyrosine/serine phosphatase
MQWHIENTLAGSSRPGYPQTKIITQDEVDAWITEVRQAGIQSIICLLDDNQLAFYNQLPGGLIAYYKAAGFNVAHIPTQDHKNPALCDRELQDIWNAFLELPKPVLIHCSAGKDRTGQATQYIYRKMDGNR